jgi:hypothetical protein
MSLCIRPVIETWGPHISRHTDEPESSDTLLRFLGEKAGEEPSETSGVETTEFYWDDGKKILDFFEGMDPEAVLAEYLGAGHYAGKIPPMSGEPTEAQNLLELLEALKQSAPEWRKWCHPKHGTFTLFSD